LFQGLSARVGGWLGNLLILNGSINHTDNQPEEDQLEQKIDQRNVKDMLGLSHVQPIMTTWTGLAPAAGVFFRNDPAQPILRRPLIGVLTTRSQTR
jgi:hypothetical protein